MRLSVRLLVALALAVPAMPAAADGPPPMRSETVFGYDVGAVPRESLLTSASAVWNVASATAHMPGESAAARAWVGLGGGGCVTYDCRVRDDTRIQVGTTSAVDGAGVATYAAWYRVAPFDATDVPLVVDAGDDVRGTVERVSGLPALWRITLHNLTSGTSWTTTTPGASLLLSAQWVVESDVLYDEFGQGYPLLPDLDPTRFDEIRLNGAAPDLGPEERVVFVPALTEDVVGTPSLPQPDGDGFGACAWATTCPVPPNF